MSNYTLSFTAQFDRAKVGEWKREHDSYESVLETIRALRREAFEAGYSGPFTPIIARDGVQIAWNDRLPGHSALSKRIN